MPVSFQTLQIGQYYDRPQLAQLWGYQGFQAISRGVVTPAGTNLIILFVTQEKQQALTQYNDYIDGGYLFWEGEEKHGSDLRITNAKENGDEIHLFYRNIHHSPFVYMGQITLDHYQLHSDRPSRFVFETLKSHDVLADFQAHDEELQQLNPTERKAVVKSRIGQGLFRDRVVDKWKVCSVTGLTNLSLLRASHIKPWRASNNYERLDGDNGLLLQPALDHLFDNGLISFSDRGEILISTMLNESDLITLNVRPDMALRRLTDPLAQYLDYHRREVYEPISVIP